MSTSDQKHAIKVRLNKIPDEAIGQRIDNYLAKVLKGVPKSLIYKIIRTGEVRVNGGRIKPDYRLVENDLVRIPPVATSPTKKPIAPGGRAVDSVLKSIIYEDDNLLVLNKPSGMPVHGGTGLSYGVIDALRAARPEAKFIELVHRLDKGTSGCLIIAKKPSVLRSLHDMLRDGQVEKRYLCLAIGVWKGKSRTVDIPLKKNTLKSGERIVTVDEEGKESVTHFSLREKFGNYSLLEAKLETGRTHQIRVHAQAIGFPLAGDEKYGDKDANHTLKKLGLNRMFLHAEKISFTLPNAKIPIVLSAALPQELQLVLNQLRNE